MVNMNTQSPVSFFNNLNRSLMMSELKQKRQSYNNQVRVPSKPVSKPTSPANNNNPAVYSLNYAGTDYAVSANPNGTFSANVNGENYGLSLGENNMLTVTHGKDRAQLGQVVSDGDGTYSVISNPQQAQNQPQQPAQPQPSSYYSLNYAGTDYAVTYNPNNNTFTTNVNGNPITLTGGQNNMLYATSGNITAPVGQVVADGDGTFSVLG